MEVLKYILNIYVIQGEVPHSSWEPLPESSSGSCAFCWYTAQWELFGCWRRVYLSVLNWCFEKQGSLCLSHIKETDTWTLLDLPLNGSVLWVIGIRQAITWFSPSDVLFLGIVMSSLRLGPVLPSVLSVWKVQWCPCRSVLGCLLPLFPLLLELEVFRCLGRTFSQVIGVWHIYKEEKKEANTNLEPIHNCRIEINSS